MADKNGTLLARQVRRFIEKYPNSKCLENVEESAKKTILLLGNPGHYADESERVLPIPLELHSKRSFESQYKKLQKEYPTLPDLKGKGQDKEKDKEGREKKEREERERKEREERERKEREEREKKEREEREKKGHEEREKKEREERERKEREERERKEREEREKKEREERERKEREEREKKGYEEREKKEREERERKEREEREKKEREEREKKEREERERKEREEREKKGYEEREKKEREERERKEREEREKKERKEREKKGHEEREKKEREERERKDREERERKEREEREKKEREEREKKGYEEREKREREERERKEREERERKEKEEREKKGYEEREKKEREERENKEREERERKDQGNNQSNILDQLRAIPVEQLRGLLQDLGVPSRESSVTSERTSNTSFQGSRETSANTSLQKSRETSVNTTSSWNTKGSSVDTSLQVSGRWRKVREKLGDDTGYWLSSLSEICEDNDCDFADVKFYLEYLLRQDSDRTNSELTDLAIEFINDCPGSQARFLEDLREKDPQLKRAYDKYYTPAQSIGETKERRAWARNPQAYRDRLFKGLPPEDEEHWDQITLHFDPDTTFDNVKGRITASVAEFLDVCLPSLNSSNEERHYLALKSDYPQETRRFEDSERGRLLTIKPQSKGSLKGRQKSDIKILNYSCAYQPYPDAYPRMYFFGIDKKKKNIIKAWARTTYCETREFKGGLDDLNDQRKACGQKEITTVSRPHRRWPNRDTGSNSDSNSDFDSENELA